LPFPHSFHLKQIYHKSTLFISCGRSYVRPILTELQFILLTASENKNAVRKVRAAVDL